MFPLFHIFFPLFILELVLLITKNKKNKLEKIQRFWLMLGSILPDLIDKPISIITKLVSGRGIAHTPIFLIFLCILIYILTRNKWISLSLGFGMIFHLLLDIPEVPWFWPIIPLEGYQDVFDSWIYTLLHDPLIFSTEIISLIGILGIIVSYKIIFNGKLINWQNVNSFLFKTPKSLKILRTK
ncbi:MAG: metal-dependent hydrolase [Promethearchaeota archaeon]